MPHDAVARGGWRTAPVPPMLEGRSNHGRQPEARTTGHTSEGDTRDAATGVQRGWLQGDGLFGPGLFRGQDEESDEET